MLYYHCHPDSYKWKKRQCLEKKMTLRVLGGRERAVEGERSTKRDLRQFMLKVVAKYFLECNLGVSRAEDRATSRNQRM
jgi:hypothetical protein